MANAFTRFMYEVTLYVPPLPPPLELQINLIIGGRAAFTCLRQVFHGSLSASEQLQYQDTVNSFQESSSYRVLTEGDDSKYGNQNFLNEIEVRADSVKDYPAVVEFGGTPAFIALYQLALTKARQDELKEAYAMYCKNCSRSLIIPGPYLRARCAKSNLRVGRLDLAVSYTTENLTIDWPDGVPVKALVPGVLVPVTRWETYRDFVDFPYYTRIWRRFGPTDDYVELSHIAYTFLNKTK
ncbi:hypothetical protein ARMSODRAFT_1014280 [Armillaria solidipes]|uniref:Uncharacterized protein n=1 Tax=Armillaria solidipes TaxID=1076256 RepID=A0A2H3BY85_9AGAR|nr:hypothetical protein ARMSODRAFT_1014280 [Armillaria solidipes]